VEHTAPESLTSDILYGQPLYPAAPLSWMAPLWSFICGAAASGAWSWTAAALLRMAWGLLLAGPLLGLVWAVSISNGWRESLMDDPPPAADDAGRALPYTLSGSASHRLAAWLSAVSAWWHQVRPAIGKPTLQLAVCSAFSLIVAGQWGVPSLVLAVLGLATAYACGLGLAKRPFGVLVSIACPMFIAWALGHAAFTRLRPVSLLAAVLFAIIFYSCSALNEHKKPLVAWQAAAQTAAVGSLIAVKQPLMAAAVALLGTLPSLLLPALETRQGRERYFRSTQWPLAASMLLTALAIGYRP